MLAVRPSSVGGCKPFGQRSRLICETSEAYEVLLDEFQRVRYLPTTWFSRGGE